MYAWRIAKRAYALDRQGTGARLAGGRWNSPGIAAIYAGMTPEIAAMEKLVHTSEKIPMDLVLVKMSMPDDANYITVKIDELPAGWDAIPGSVSALIFGDAFLITNTHLGLIVPSAVMPEARNIVINPNHSKFSQISMEIIRPFTFDSRIG